MTKLARTSCASALFAATSLAISAPVHAGDLVVTVDGITAQQGEIGIALFSSPDGFPLDYSKVNPVWFPAKSNTIQYAFANLAQGRYAVAVLQDFVGDHKMPTNFLGKPKEPWGVSNNVRFAFRAPKFDEAAVTISADKPTLVTISLKR